MATRLSPFASTLRLLMNEYPVTTQAQLANITGKTRQTVSQYVNGISEPGYDTLVKIADHFQVSLDYLLGRIKIRTFCRDVSDGVIVLHGMLEDVNPVEIASHIARGDLDLWCEIWREQARQRIAAVAVNAPEGVEK